MDFFTAFITLILFNPIAWAIIVGVIIVISDRRKKDSQRHSQSPDGIVHDEFGAQRLEALAEAAHSQSEKSILVRAAQALRFGLTFLPATPTKSSQVVTSKGVVNNSEPKPLVEDITHSVERSSTTPKEVSEPLAEKGLKALQNINILLYLGAFFVVIASGAFIGSTYGSLGDAAKVALLGLFTAVFYLGGLTLFVTTTRIRPAGVTFTAIGLLLAPLVGVAAQTLLFAGQNPGPVWLVTSIILVIMQAVAFLVIRKSYIAYYGALTTISLFQALTATTQAPVYWYGWAMLMTSMGYIFLAKFWHESEFGEPFRIVAQIFVPISVVISLLGFQEYGLWSIGVQLVITSLFYMLCAMLKDFDQSPEELNYIMLASILFPIGFGLTLWARDVPHLGVALTVMLIGVVYFIAEKLAPEVKHKPIYGVLSTLIVFIAPLIVWTEPQQMVWLAIAGGVLQAVHYFLTRFRPTFTALQTTILVLPLGIGYFLFTPAMRLEQIAMIMLAVAVVLAGLAQFVLLPKSIDLADEQDGFVIIGLALASVLAFMSASAQWLSIVLVGSGTVFAAMSIWRSPKLIIGVAISWYLAIAGLSSWLHLSVVMSSVVILGVAGLLFVMYRLISGIRQEKTLSAVVYGVGIVASYLVALSSNELSAAAVMSLATLLVIGISYLEKSEEAILPATVMSYGVVLYLANQQQWLYAPTLLVWSMVLYGLGWLGQDRRLQLVRQTALVGFLGALAVSFGEVINPWLGVLIHVVTGSAIMAEAYRLQHRAGKYIASAVLWTAVLRAYDAMRIDFAQLYIQTTAVYLVALAYRQYQRGARQAQDVLAVGALVVSTVPLAFQALDDKTGGYTLAILGLGIAYTVLGMVMHYNLVRTWGIATLIIIVLYKTAGTIFSLPPWVWLGIIGIATLVGAIYLLFRRPTEDTPDKQKKLPKAIDKSQ